MEMTLRKHVLCFCAIAILLFTAAGCKKVDAPKVTSCSLLSLNLNGTRSADVVLSVGVDNQRMAFTLTDIQGTVRVGEKTAATFSADSISVDAKSSKVYEIPLTATLDKSITLMNAMSLMSGKDPSDIKMDVTARVSTKRGLGKTLTFNDIAIGELLDL